MLADAEREQVRMRCEKAARYIVEERSTVRGAAAHLGISKSTVHKDVTERLLHNDPQLYRKVKRVLEKNKQERHIRGGMATRRKYKGDCNI